MIKAVNLSFRYPHTNANTLTDLNFSIGAGEIYGFLGPSGAGKSTTQKILINLLSGYHGSLSIMDKELKHWDKTLYNHIGVGFELPNHYLKLSALENLRLFASLYNKPLPDFDMLLKRAGLFEHRHKKLEQYSKGMKMRLNFIRALMHDPEILFFDEPTSGLDPVNATMVKEWIKELRSKGKCIFLTTHNMFDADELCDRISFLHQGQIALTDAPRALKIKHGQPVVAVLAQGQTVEVEFPLQGLGNNKSFIDFLATNEIVSMHSREASINEIFIKVTGSHLQQSEHEQDTGK